MSICVLGAGINGLSTATQIQRAEPRASVTLIADQFSPHLTSDVAAGHWRPVYLGADANIDQVITWSKETFDYLESLAWDDGYRYGAHWQSGYQFATTPIEDIYYVDGIARNFRTLSFNEVQQLCSVDKYTTGIFYTSIALEGTKYLPVLMEEFRRFGGKVIRRKVDDIQTLVDAYDVVVNCTGLGARELLDDKKMYPIRGQVFRAVAPAVKHFYIFNDHQTDTDRYILPNLDWLVVGGTHTTNDWNLNWSEKDANDIWTDVCRHVPNMKSAKIIDRKVGLRPARSSIRLESESCFDSRGRPKTIVHNYGHGGSGLTLFHGTALDASELTKQAVATSTSHHVKPKL